jgi:endogenous inhibitor of DNA gyrase (YacG/DUF329 family)
VLVQQSKGTRRPRAIHLSGLNPHQYVPTSTERLHDFSSPNAGTKSQTVTPHLRQTPCVRTFVASPLVSSRDDGETGLPLPHGKCPRCGTAWIGRRSGRPRVRCSQRCRRAAYEERRAAASGAIAIRDAGPSQTIEHDLNESVRRVAGSPAACRRLLRALRERDQVARLATELRWEPVREVGHLMVRLTAELQRRSPRRWR